MNNEENLKGLGGWLILVGIGIVFSPYKIIAFLYPIYSEIIVSGNLELILTNGSELYHPLLGALIIVEVICNASMLLAWFYVAYLFFTEKKQFPMLYIGLRIFTVVFMFLDFLAASVIFPDEPLFSQSNIKEIIPPSIGALIFIPYILMSRRVKATFIR